MTGMRLKRLEMLLSRVKGFPSPSARHEQYVTPPDLAARLLFHAHMRGDIAGRRVCDLGCGTGILAIGAALLGAAEVIGVERDPRALQVASENGDELGVSLRFFELRLPHPDLISLVGPCDTVVMNPPFGAQDPHADRPFIDAALAIAPAVYGIFNAGSRDFVKGYTGERAEVEEVVGGTLSMRRTFSHHTKDVRETPVEIIVLRRRML
ncbi:MAG: ribosomal protein L11 methyltransferase [Methanoregulaceae archaeon PtaB.Bin056]|jgi:putative methylase|nr:MAG: ribosomal protein L11 methyltransferase [Methanoregulaceae archaeon PtaB.Bin056]